MFDEMRLYFVRHGESEANVLHIISNRGVKHGLTKRGREEVLGLADQLASISVLKIYSSPLLRAIQTAQILSDGFDIDFEITEALREYDCGVLEGKSDIDSWGSYSDVFRDWIYCNRWERRIEGGESFLDMKTRFVPFIEQLIETYRSCSVNIVLVGHGGLYRCMLPLLLDNIDFDYAVSHSLKNAGYISTVVTNGRIICKQWNGEILQV
jgi:broad specificity phosphatase PhoE